MFLVLLTSSIDRGFQVIIVSIYYIIILLHIIVIVIEGKLNTAMRMTRYAVILSAIRVSLFHLDTRVTRSIILSVSKILSVTPIVRGPLCGFTTSPPTGGRTYRRYYAFHMSGTRPTVSGHHGYGSEQCGSTQTSMVS